MKRILRTDSTDENSKAMTIRVRRPVQMRTYDLNTSVMYVGLATKILLEAKPQNTGLSAVNR